MVRYYSEISKIKTFEDRYKYLKLGGTVGVSTFGFDRYLNQAFYLSDKWKKARDRVIVRDNACDLGMDDYEINGPIYVHHINPITIEDVELDKSILYDPEFLICASKLTHTAIHYSNESLLPKPFIARKRNDTCPWK